MFNFFLRISVCNELDKIKFNWTCFADMNGVEDKWTYSLFRNCVKVRAVFQGKRSKCCTSTMTWPPSVSHCLHHLNLFKAFGSIETYVRICLFRLWCSVECRKGGRETFLKNDPQTVTGDFNISFSLQYKSPVSIA